jgi:hypothetical protein
MFISVHPSVSAAGIFLILLLLGLLIMYELLPEQKKMRVKGVLLACILVLLAGAVLVFTNRLEEII